MLPNHHITKPVLIGEIQADGQFDVVSGRPGLVGRRLVRLPRRLQGPDRRLGRAEKCGNFNVKPPASAPAAVPELKRGKGGTVDQRPAALRIA
jgi:hypothetical protein